MNGWIKLKHKSIKLKIKFMKGLQLKISTLLRRDFRDFNNKSRFRSKKLKKRQKEQSN